MANYQDYSKEELLAIIQKQQEELKNKKYGLVWDSEREPEQVVLDCENNLPVLTRVKGKEIRTTDGEDNILIEGDNYHALTVLSYTHKEKIDVIYIDPPYNTGNKDFKYNDRYVDSDDGFKHSKWLNFMEKRLNLAKNLLKEKGLIFISIDDNEFAQLKLLCDRIFAEENFRNSIVVSRVKKNIQEREYVRGLNLGHGTILFYAMLQAEIVIPTKFQRKEERWHAFDAPGIRKTMEYELFGHKPPKGRHWMFEKSKIASLVKKECLRPNPKTGKPQYKLEASDFTRLDSNWSDLQEGDSKWNFENGEKNIELIKRLLGMCPNKNFTVLDFFAGSGTTGHAVLELNKIDGGNRKFILCTNNELNGFEKELRKKGFSEKEIQKNGICQKITYPRLEKVIKGYKKNGNGEKVKGLGGNLQYFRTRFVRKTNNRDQVRLSLTGKCTEMLCVKENIFNLEKENDDYKIFSSNNKNKYLCVYYNFSEDGIEEFIGEIKKIKSRKIIYMFSVDNEVDKSIFSGIEDFTVEAIPEAILKEYEKLNKLNIPINKDLIYFNLNKANKAIFEQGEKNDGAVFLRIALEKTILKIAQANGIGLLKQNGREEKIALLNDRLKSGNIFSKVEWEENKTYLAIGNHAAHGEYGEYDLNQAKNFYQHIQMLLNKFNI